MLIVVNKLAAERKQVPSRMRITNTPSGQTYVISSDPINVTNEEDLEFLLGLKVKTPWGQEIPCCMEWQPEGSAREWSEADTKALSEELEALLNANNQLQERVAQLEAEVDNLKAAGAKYPSSGRGRRNAGTSDTAEEPTE